MDPEDPTAPTRQPVALCSHSLERNGANNCLLFIATRLVNEQRVCILTPKEGPMREDFEALGCKVVHLPTEVKDYEEKMTSLLSSCGMVIANTMMRAEVVCIAKTLKLPSLWVIHEAWPRDQMRAYAEKTFLTSHITPDVIEKAFEQATRIVFPAQVQKRLYDGLYKESQASVVYNGIPLDLLDKAKATLDRDAERRALGAEPSDFLILHLGTICKRKGQRNTARAFRRLVQKDGLRNAKLALVGARYIRQHEIDYIADIKKELADAGLEDRVRILDIQKDVRRFYVAADVVLVPSLNEVLPLVVCEAMAMRKPVVASKIDGIPEALTDGEEGFLIKPNSATAIADAVLKLYRDPGLRERMGELGRKRVLRQFSYDSMTTQYRGVADAIALTTIPAAATAAATAAAAAAAAADKEAESTASAPARSDRHQAEERASPSSGVDAVPAKAIPRPDSAGVLPAASSSSSSSSSSIAADGLRVRVAPRVNSFSRFPASYASSTGSDMELDARGPATPAMSSYGGPGSVASSPFHGSMRGAVSFGSLSSLRGAESSTDDDAAVADGDSDTSEFSRGGRVTGDGIMASLSAGGSIGNGSNKARRWMASGTGPHGDSNTGASPPLASTRKTSRRRRARQQTGAGEPGMPIAIPPGQTSPPSSPAQVSMPFTALMQGFPVYVIPPDTLQQLAASGNAIAVPMDSAPAANLTHSLPPPHSYSPITALPTAMAPRRRSWRSNSHDGVLADLAGETPGLASASNMAGTPDPAAAAAVTTSHSPTAHRGANPPPASSASLRQEARLPAATTSSSSAASSWSSPLPTSSALQHQQHQQQSVSASTVFSAAETSAPAYSTAAPATSAAVVTASVSTAPPVPPPPMGCQTLATINESGHPHGAHGKHGTPVSSAVDAALFASSSAPAPGQGSSAPVSAPAAHSSAASTPSASERLAKATASDTSLSGASSGTSGVVLVDMDSTLVDFDAAFFERWVRRFPERAESDALMLRSRALYELESNFPEELRPAVVETIAEPGLFASMPAIEGAVSALKEMLAAGFDVRIVTAPHPACYVSCAAEKYGWVEKHMGPQWCSRLILARDKTHVRGTLLIDDKPAVKGSQTPTWTHVLFTQPWNTHIPDAPRLSSWSEWPQTLLEAIESKQDEPSA